MATGRTKPRIAISVGDPGGIGPEITRAALAEASVKPLAEFVLFGETGKAFPASPTAEGGRQSFDAVMGAIDAVKAGVADAVVTGPISKEAWHAAGITRWPGHTELLAEAFASPASGMLFVGPRLRVILATVHMPLREVPGAISAGGVYEKIMLGQHACVDLGVARPRIAVAGINPHAGEGGLFGDEDARLIAPAVARARAEGVDVSGPLPGDAVFIAAAGGAYDLVVAMYHDQGLIPVKLLDGRSAVNMTVGLRWGGRTVVRTSPAHGTAFDIAGTGRADATSMVCAIRLAVEMVLGARGR